MSRTTTKTKRSTTSTKKVARRKVAGSGVKKKTSVRKKATSTSSKPKTATKKVSKKKTAAKKATKKTAVRKKTNHQKASNSSLSAKKSSKKTTTAALKSAKKRSSKIEKPVVNEAEPAPKVRKSRTVKNQAIKPASRSRFSLHSQSNSKKSKSAGGLKAKKPSKKVGPKQLDKLTDDQLLDLRLCDLDLDIRQTDVQPRVDRLYEELTDRGIEFLPHVWLSDEWFSPDGIPGIAIPFYLAHPRLMRLERKMMLEVEGGTEDWCMRILRHEAGHTLDTAFRLNRKRMYREIFGKYSDPYPEYYRPKPKSRKFVVHLEPWYAQSHPAEDFAETFAVCLRPGSRWKTHYKKWPAIKKLEFVDQLINSLAGQKPKVRSRKKIDSITGLKKTLRDHYQQRRAKYEIDMPTPFDRDLKKLFCLPVGSDSKRITIPISAPNDLKSDVDTDLNGIESYGIGQHQPSPISVIKNGNHGSNNVDCMASALLRKHRTDIERQVTKWTGENRYTVNLVMREIIDRCRKLRLRAMGDETELLRNTAILVTVQTMHYLHSGLHRVAL